MFPVLCSVSLDLVQVDFIENASWSNGIPCISAPHINVYFWLIYFLLPETNLCLKLGAVAVLKNQFRFHILRIPRSGC
jgi:hypothetical protein